MYVACGRMVWHVIRCYRMLPTAVDFLLAEADWSKPVKDNKFFVLFLFVSITILLFHLRRLAHRSQKNASVRYCAQLSSLRNETIFHSWKTSNSFYRASQYWAVNILYIFVDIFGHLVDTLTYFDCSYWPVLAGIGSYFSRLEPCTVSRCEQLWRGKFEKIQQCRNESTRVHRDITSQNRSKPHFDPMDKLVVKVGQSVIVKNES